MFELYIITSLLLSLSCNNKIQTVCLVPTLSSQITSGMFYDLHVNDCHGRIVTFNVQVLVFSTKHPPTFQGKYVSLTQLVQISV